MKIGGIVLVLLLALLVAAYFWFVHHAESILRDIVRARTNGTIELSLNSITYDFSTRRLNLKDAVIFNTDSVAKKSAFRVSVKRVSLQLHRLRSLVLHRELVIDSLLIQHPDIRVMKSDTLERRHGSLPHEIGDVYHSIQNALSLFEVKHFRLLDGRFLLDNQARTDWQPVAISNIYFAINNIRVGADDTGSDSLHFTEDIEFRTDHQLITFPDNRYRLGFSQFRIHVRNREISLDSCTVVSTGARQQPLALNLYFDKLRFSNIDFPALYANGQIKADSMYATNPVLDLQVTMDSTRHRERVPPMPMDTVLRHLGVNLQLGYMAVKNATTSVVTTRDGKAATFKTKGDDFEVRQLVIDRRAPQPISIGRFDMAIRGYSSLNKDSTYRFQFDSIRIVNSNILLNNFTISSLDGAPVQRHHELPVLELDSLSWESLIFDRRILAKQAILYQPEILYIRRTQAQRNGKKTSLFSILNSLDNIMSLERIRVIDGHVSYEPSPGTKLLLEQVDLTVSTNQLLGARSSSMMGDAVDSLHFRKGSITTPKWQGTIQGGSFLANGTHLRADDAVIRNKSGNMTIHAKGLHLAGLDFNDSSEQVRIDQLAWQEATVSLQPDPSAGAAGKPLALRILARQIDGAHTRLNLHTRQGLLQTYIDRLSLRNVSKQEGADATVASVHITGRNTQYTSKDLRINSGAYQVTDGAASRIDDLRITHTGGHDSIAATIPALRFVPDIAALLDGRLLFRSVALQAPVLWMSLGKGPAVATTAPATRKALPILRIGSLTLEQPVIRFHQQQEAQAIQLVWDKGPIAANNEWVIKNIVHDGKGPLQIQQVSINGTDVTFTHQGKDALQLKPQRIQLVLSHLQLAAGHPSATPWAGTLEHLDIKDLSLQGIGKDSGRLHLASLTLEHLALQAKQSPHEWIAQSPKFYLRDLSGEFMSLRDAFRWKKLSYHHAQRLLSVDSFNYRPVADRDAWVASKPFQGDYIQLQTGRIDFHQPDLRSLLQDSIVYIPAVAIQEPAISLYRDKRPPREPNVIRQLPVNQLKRIPFRLRMDSITLSNGRVQYEELSEKTNKSGIIPITQLNAMLAHVKSFGIGDNDSLKLQAQAKLFDSIDVSLRLHESYTDSLAAFLMTTRIGPANLLLLNSAVEPLASVRIRSGRLDTLTMRAIGREYLSYGEMTMKYQRLNVEFLQKGDEEKKTFVTKAITFIANAFVIKSRNRGKSGIVYFERLRDRSIFNYMIKMLLSGAGSSIGAKSNKKYLKHYKRELRRQQLPDIHYQ